MKIIILNLPRDVSESEMGALFQPYGTVSACTLVMDVLSGTSKGFGFVEMEEEGAALAIAALNGSKLRQNKIRVKVAD